MTRIGGSRSNIAGDGLVGGWNMEWGCYNNNMPVKEGEEIHISFHGSFYGCLSNACFLRACMLVYKTTPTFLLGKWEENLVDHLQMVVPKFCKNTVKDPRNNVQTCSLVVFILI